MIGIAVWNFSEGTLAERIDRFAGMGFTAVSLLARHAAEMARGVTPEVEDAILRNSLGVAIHGSMSNKGVPAEESAILADFEAFQEWHFRTRSLLTVNYDPATRLVGEEAVYDHEMMHSALLRMLQESGGAGFTVGIEDWPRDASMLESVSDLLGFPHYGILIDLGHMNMRIANTVAGGPYPIEAAREYLDSITLPINELHVHSNDGIRDQHAPLDRGTADFAALGGILKSRLGTALHTVEIAPQLCGLSEDVCVDGSRAALATWRELF